MKGSSFIYFLIFLVFISILSGCKQSEFESSTAPANDLTKFVGDYFNTADPTVTLRIAPQGYFEVINSCLYQDYFSAPDEFDLVDMVLTRTKPITGCNPEGDYVCLIQLTEPYLLFDCGGTMQLLYKRI